MVHDGAMDAVNIDGVRKLTTNDALQSLKLNVDIKNSNKILTQLISNEENFIRERICFGKFIDEKLVSRGAIMSIAGNYASVGAFYTIETERKKGYASDIIKATIMEASRHSKNACLFVRNNNSNAINLYKKLGFICTGHAWFHDIGTGLSP